MDLSNIPIIDHHTHALLREGGPFTMTGFQRFFTESDDPRIHADHAGQTLFFRWAIKELAAYFDCEPTAAAVLAARNSVPPDELGARMFRDANLAVLLIDYGFGAHIHLSPDELQARWDDEADRRRVADLEERMKALGISGVPTFILGRRLAVSGAQPPEALAAAIREATIPA